MNGWIPAEEIIEAFFIYVPFSVYLVLSHDEQTIPPHSTVNQITGLFLSPTNRLFSRTNGQALKDPSLSSTP